MYSEGLPVAQQLEFSERVDPESPRPASAVPGLPLGNETTFTHQSVHVVDLDTLVEYPRTEPGHHRRAPPEGNG